MLQFRPLATSDQDKLWHWLHIALWDPPPAGLRPIEVLQAAAARQAGYDQVSLTVHPQNPAQFMYERCGFRKVESRNTYLLMVASTRFGT